MLDPITEAIAHFIGYFHLGTEELRLRQSYEQFHHERALKDEIQTHDPHPIQKTSFSLEGFKPVLNWQPKFQDDGFFPELHKLAAPDVSLMPMKAGPGVVPPPEFQVQPALWMHPSPPFDTSLTLAVPSSVATVTWQTLTLQDDDVLGQMDGATFASPESFVTRLDDLIETAQSLSATTPPVADGESPWVSIAASLKAQVEAVTQDEAGSGALAGVSGFAVTGSGASDAFVNGDVAMEMPDLADKIPAYIKERDEDKDDELPEAVPDSHISPMPQPSGHLVAAGANVLHNEVEIISVWVDASVIVVAGDVTRIDAVDQVNVLRDYDNLGVCTPHNAPSVLLNAAQIDMTSAPAGGTGSSAAFPSNWAVTQIEGDLICYNWISQTSYVTDHDRAVITSMGSNTYISLGENEITNIALLAELGYRYDMIVVGGDMYDISYIYQSNVLLDDDTVVGASALGSDNMLFNSASIQSAGIDSFGELTPFARDVLQAAANGDDMPSLPSGEDMFPLAGALKVLYISGDLVTSNLVTQTNVLGDNDQVMLAAEAAALADGVTVVTGSNVLANIASIREFGVDSTVVAGGDIYSDALIHQAGFVSPDAAPNGVARPGLVSEAVAFLVDDMIDGTTGPSDLAGLAPLPMDGGSLDIMQTMLA